jgi:hypothetical protein
LRAGDVIASKLEVVEVGRDEDGEIISSCVIRPTEVSVATTRGPKLTKNQQTMFSILHGARPGGLTTERWYDMARNEGLGIAKQTCTIFARH